MKLTLSEAAQLLQVSERTLQRWTRDLSLPHEGVASGLSFDRDELIRWADAHSFRIALEVPGEAPASLPTLGSCVRRGGIHYELGGGTVEDALGEACYRMALPDLVDREFLHQVLLAREDLGSTGLGDGFAIPHVRAPLVLHRRPVRRRLLCLLDRPVAWGLDRQGPGPHALRRPVPGHPPAPPPALADLLLPPRRPPPRAPLRPRLRRRNPRPSTTSTSSSSADRQGRRPATCLLGGRERDVGSHRGPLRSRTPSRPPVRSDV
ncbi:MAG: helix-turn-helix domain-containing protein [Planctomycetota bacterium]